MRPEQQHERGTRSRRRSGTRGLESRRALIRGSWSATQLLLLALVPGCEASPGVDTPGSREAAAGGAATVAAMGSEELVPIETEEYRARRGRLLERLDDGLLLVHARTGPKAIEQWGFLQDPTFLYLTGLAELPAAILALDGPARTTHLFLPPPPQPFGVPVEEAVPPAGAATATRLGLDSVRPWSDFAGWVSGRVRDGVRTLYVEGPEGWEPTGAPPGLPPVAGERGLWRDALAETFPEARVLDASPTISEVRAVKSDAEVARLALNARRTVHALQTVATQLEPGLTERAMEATVVTACIEAGGQGPSFWPWIMSGPNAHIERVLGTVLLYDQGDRVARAGELVRVDIGCAGELYGGDVGRTLPVSGRFDDGQAEAWDLLIAGYRAGLEAMADGVPVADVRAASRGEVDRRAGSLRTATGRAAAEAILSGGDYVWHIHGVGIDSGEDIPDTLEAGMVVAYEPGVSVGEDAFYLEDMILVTESGHRILSDGLPYSADEIAQVMR